VAKPNQRGFCDLIDYFGLADDGIVSTVNGVHLAAWEFAGFDMESMSMGEAFSLADRLGRNLGLGPGWCVQTDLMRHPCPEYLPGEVTWPSVGARIVEEERRGRFLIEDNRFALRASRYFFCLSFDPKERGLGGISKRVVGIHDEDTDHRSVLSRFQAKVIEMEQLLRGSVREIRRLRGYSRVVGDTEVHCDELLEYLRACICGLFYPFVVPESGIDLNAYLAVDDFTGGGSMKLGHPESDVLGGQHIRVIAINSFPEKSFASILRALDSVPYSFRFSQQAQIKDEMRAANEHKANATKWNRKGSGGAKAEVRQVGAHELDTYALSLANDAALARSEAEHGREYFCAYSGKVILMDRDLGMVADAATKIMQTLRRSGFGSHSEDVNGVAAWLGSFPGQQYKDERKFTLHTRNVAHMMPLSAPYRGLSYNPSPFFPRGSSPLLLALTAGGTTYRVNLHSGDVGHSLIVGPNGSGKTSAIALMIASALRYPDVQIYNFDKKRSLFTMTTCLGGAFIELSAESQDRLCPLANLDSIQQIQWANQYVAFLAELNALPITPDVTNDINRAVYRLSLSPSCRSMTALHSACSLPELKASLQFYLGTLLDGDRDKLNVSQFVTFEMDELYSLDPKLMNGALFYLFGRIRQRLRSSVPTFMFVDEFTAALTHPLAAKAFKEYLLEGRKLNLAVSLAVQELGSVLDSPLRSVVAGQAFTKLFLPNAQAALDERGNYEKLGCSVVDCSIIAEATPKSHYYHVAPEGKRLISLELGPVFLAFLSSSDKDRFYLQNLLAAHGHEEAVARWLEWKQLSNWAKRYRVLAELETTTEGEGLKVYA
jgi:type IV secretion system protein VirB4